MTDTDTHSFCQAVLLGTVAIEPNRWGTVHADRMPMCAVGEWADSIGGAGFDGIEVWDQHLTMASPTDVERILGTLSVPVFNSYASLDVADASERAFVADWVGRCGASAVKFNVGNDAAAERDYAERIAGWLELLPDTASLICECHEGISIAEDPIVAARIFDAAGPPERLGALIHTHESLDHLAERFDAYGDRIRHVHVNYLDVANRSVPALADRRTDLEASVSFLRSQGFTGTWTVEFVSGILSPDDHPEALMARAAEDVAVLRDVLL